MSTLATRADRAPLSRPPVSTVQLAAYGAGGIIPIALFNIAGILVGLMGNISLGLSAFWLGAILIIPRLWDAVSGPVIGHLSDNTRTRWGRRRPFLLAGGILVSVFFVIMWWIPKGATVRAWFPTETGFQAFQLVYLLVMLLLFFTACDLFEIPHGALGMELTRDPHARTRLFSAKSFVGNLFAMSTPWLFALANLPVFKGPSGNEADGMRYVALMVAALVIPASFWWTLTLREPGFTAAAQQEKAPFWTDMKRTAGNRNFILLTLTIFTLAMGFNFVQLLGSYIPIFYVFGGDKVAGATLLGINGTVWAVTGMVAVFPLNWLAPRLGKRNTLIVAIALMCLAQLSKVVCYSPTYPYLLVIPTFLLSTGMLFFFTLGSSSVGDICDEDELHTHRRVEGSYYSVFWWFIKMGTALASFVAGALIVFTMFDETQVTKVDALAGSLRDLRGQVQAWRHDGSAAVDRAKPLDEARELAAVLGKELQRGAGEGHEHVPAYAERRERMLSLAVSETRAVVAGLQELASPGSAGAAGQAATNRLVALSLRTKLEKARLSAFELETHLEEKAHDATRDRDHYRALVVKVAAIAASLAAMDAGEPLAELDPKVTALEGSIVPLTKQTPYTLLMMRVVEIGLPVLLALLSLFFILRYSLTERRTLEIKALLAERHAQDGPGEGAAPEPASSS